VLHLQDDKSGGITFIAFDSFNSHHFNLIKGKDDYTADTLSQFKTYYGNNETQMQLRIRNLFKSTQISDEEKY
jgi:hypothetical protein